MLEKISNLMLNMEFGIYIVRRTALKSPPLRCVGNEFLRVSASETGQTRQECGVMAYLEYATDVTSFTVSQ